MDQWQQILVGFCILIVPLVLASRSFKKKKKLPPGPGGWPLLGSLPLLGATPHLGLQKLAAKYGPLMFMKLGTTDTLVVSSPEMAEKFLKTYDHMFVNRPPNAGATHVAYGGHDLVFAPYGRRWRLLRKVCSVHLFSAKAIDDMQNLRFSELAYLLNSLYSSHGQPVNVGKLLNVCTANALGQVTVGKRVFSDEADGSEFRTMVLELMVLAGKFIIGDFVPWLSWLDPQGVQAEMKKLGKRFDSFLQDMVTEHMKKGNLSEKKDLLSVMLALKDNADGEGGTLSLTDIKALLLNLFVAGTDTSSSTTEWALAELIRNPALMKKCQEEMDSVIGRDRLISERDLVKLPYFQAIMKETFRLHPSTPLLLPHMCVEGGEVGGYTIPKNTRLMVNAWGIQRDPKVWTDPLEFIPERFIGSEIDVKGNHFELFPFGAGRRICAGMSMGIRMVQIMLATLLHSFDWSLPDGHTREKMNMEEVFGLTLQRAQPLVAVPKPRLPHNLYQLQ